MPLDEQFIGGATPPSPTPPVVPPKDVRYGHQMLHRNGNEGSTWEPRPIRKSEATSITSSQLSHLTAVERSRVLRVARMNPHLQFMAGPLLRYDTVDESGIWNGAALIVSAYL
jgi:hypothetical protein